LQGIDPAHGGFEGAAGIEMEAVFDLVLGLDAQAGIFGKIEIAYRLMHAGDEAVKTRPENVGEEKMIRYAAVAGFVAVVGVGIDAGKIKHSILSGFLLRARFRFCASGGFRSGFGGCLFSAAHVIFHVLFHVVDVLAGAGEYGLGGAVVVMLVRETAVVVARGDDAARVFFLAFFRVLGFLFFGHFAPFRLSLNAVAGLAAQRSPATAPSVPGGTS